MKDDEDNIQFETIPTMDWGNFGKPQQEKSQEKEYNSLYDELVDKCNPIRFNIEDVGLEKFNAANSIYAQLMASGNTIPEKMLVALRNQAMDELGIHISTKKKFEYLKSFFNPEIYINRIPYNEQIVREAGFWYDKLLRNANDIRALEKIEFDADDFIQEEERHQQNKLVNEEEECYEMKSPEEYLKLYPQGIHVEDAKYDLEENRFRHQSAYVYIQNYPQGRHAQEANCFINESYGKYLKNYPNGRYAEEAAGNKASGLLVIATVIMVILGIILLSTIK